MNNNPFENKINSYLEAEKGDFPLQAFFGLFDFFPIEQCRELLWKLLKFSMYTNDDTLDAEDRLLLMDYYESLKDVLDAAYAIYQSTLEDPKFCHKPYRS